MQLTAVCLTALALVGLVGAAELTYTITPNGALRGSNTVNPTNFTFSISTNDINTFTNYWFIATIPPGEFGNETANAGARVNIRAVAPSNRPRSQQYPNATADGNGYATNGTIVATIDPRYNKLFVNQATNLKFRVTSGDPAAAAFVPYNASLVSQANAVPVSESGGKFGSVGMWNGAEYTATVPCCGARYQMPITPNYHLGYYLAANITALSGTLLSASMWEYGTAGKQNQRPFDPAPTANDLQPSLMVQTCDGSDVCTVNVGQTYWLEVQTPFDSPSSATFRFTVSLFPASNNPSPTGPNANRTASSSTGLNAAPTHAPSTLIAAFTVLFAALLAIFAH